jgi:type II secretory pathway component PulM
VSDLTGTERLLVAALAAILFALASWVALTVTFNSSRITIMEQRLEQHDAQIKEFKDDLRDHRRMTERNGNEK